MSFRRYLALLGVTVFAPAGEAMLSHGMKLQGGVSLDHLSSLVTAFLNPWVFVGVILLIGFFALYTASLSWADLSYVLPATSFGYVLLVLVAKYALHEQITPMRWLGIALITGGVGFVAGGPAKTVPVAASDLVAARAGKP